MKKTKKGYKTLLVIDTEDYEKKKKIKKNMLEIDITICLNKKSKK